MGVTSFNTNLDSSNAGLGSEAILYSSNNKIYLLEKDLHEIENDKPIKIMDGRRIQIDYEYSSPRIINEPIKEEGDSITFIQPVPLKLISYDGISFTDEANLFTLQSNIENYINTEKFVMLNTSQGIITYDKKNDFITEMNGLTPLTNPELIDFGDKIYIMDDERLYITDGYENTLVSLNTSGNNRIDRHQIFKNQLIVSTETGAAIVNENNTITELLLIDEEIGSYSLDYPKNNLLLWPSTSRNKMWHYDGSEIYEVEFRYGIAYKTSGYDKIAILSEKDSMNNRTLTFFNSETKVYDKLPEELQTNQVGTYFEQSGQGYLTMSRGDYPYRQLLIYKTGDSFNQVELLGEYLDCGDIRSDVTNGYHENGLLNAGRLFFTFDDQGNFKLMENIKKYNSTQIKVLNDEFYFIASDPIYGRQLFKMSNEPSSTEDAEIDEGKRVTFFPNPASSQINVSSSLQDSNPTMSYVIYNMDGRLISSGTTTGLIEITNLTAGSYVLEVIRGAKSESTIFIKE